MSTMPDTVAAEQLIERDRQLLIHPYLPGANAERVMMTEGSGCRLRDVEGREYLDATGGLWLAQIGHGRSEIADVASAQMRRLEYFTSFWEFSNDRAIELAGRLVELAPDPLRHVYFSSGGSESDEAALRMSRYFHSRRGHAGRNWILARRSAYHGIGYGSGSASGLPIYHEGFGPMLPHVRHLSPPWLIVTAKGITSGYVPLGAVLVSDSVADVLAEDHGFPVGFTYNGHPTACAVALRNLEIIESERLLDRAREVGGFLLAELSMLEELAVVGEVRGIGMMLGIELVADKRTREPISMHAAPHDVIRRETGVLVRDCAHTLVLSPPLVMTESEAAEVVGAVRSVLERVSPDGSIAPR